MMHLKSEDTRHGGHGRECGLHLDLPEGLDFTCLKSSNHMILPEDKTRLNALKKTNHLWKFFRGVTIKETKIIDLEKRCHPLLFGMIKDSKENKF